MGIRVRPSRDDPATVSFFRGPLLLVGQLGREGMPASDLGGNRDLTKAPAWPVPVLASADPETLDLRSDPSNPAQFTARMLAGRTREPVRVTLAPFHTVHHQRYAVYWKVLAPDNAVGPPNR